MFVKAVLQGDTAILVKKDDLAALDPAVVQKAVQCPTCGIYQLNGLVKDFRDNCGCISSYIHCRNCVGLGDKYFWELRNLKSEEEKQKRFIEILQSHPSTNLIATLEDLRVAFIVDKAA